MEKLYRSIDLSWVTSLEDAGEFKEGHCLRLFTNKAATYTFCCDTETQKIKWTTLLNPLICKK